MLNDLMGRLGKAKVELVVALLWITWRARNQSLFKGKKEDPYFLAAKVEAVVDSFKTHQFQTSSLDRERKHKFVGTLLQQIGLK